MTAVHRRLPDTRGQSMFYCDAWHACMQILSAGCMTVAKAYHIARIPQQPAAMPQECPFLSVQVVSMWLCHRKHTSGASTS